jgi:biotin carboxyl carrier protein
LTKRVEIRMPKYPECWETCGGCGSGDVVVQSVLVRAGEYLCVDDTILVLETGKVALDIPSPHSGLIAELLIADGQAVQADQLLLILETP